MGCKSYFGRRSVHETINTFPYLLPVGSAPLRHTMPASVVPKCVILIMDLGLGAAYSTRGISGVTDWLLSANASIVSPTSANTSMRNCNVPLANFICVLLFWVKG